MWRFKLHKAEINYGGPKHWKGPWDSKLGHLASVFENTARMKPLKAMEDVYKAYSEYAEREMQAHPGVKYRVILLNDPVEKASMPYCNLSLKSLYGLADSYSFSFTVNDKKDLEPSIWLPGQGWEVHAVCSLGLQELGAWPARLALQSAPARFRTQQGAPWNSAYVLCVKPISSCV